MVMKRLAIPTSLVAFVPSIALAHGQEVVFMPIGQLFAVVVAIRVFSVMCAVGVTLPFWFSSVSWFPGFLWSATGFFLIGFVPSVVVVLAIFLLQRGLIQRRKDA
jgi:hypothetical protein